MSLSGDGQSRRENKTSELKDRFTEIMQTEIKIGKKKKKLQEKRREQPIPAVQSYMVSDPK